MKAQYDFLHQINPEFAFYEFSKLEYETYHSLIRLLTPKDVLIVIDGGGNLGTLWPEEDAIICNTIKEYPDNRIVIFPQTAYYDDVNFDTKTDQFASLINRHKSILLMLRDTRSYNIFSNIIKQEKLILCPDIVLSISDALNGSEPLPRDIIGLCLRDDRESAFTQDSKDDIPSILEDAGLEYRPISTFADHNIYPDERDKVLYEKWLEFASYKLIITDRLHGMFFSVITGTPCITFDNLSGKVAGGYDWIKQLDETFFCDDIELLQDLITKILSTPIQHRNSYNDYNIADHFTILKDNGIWTK